MTAETRSMWERMREIDPDAFAASCDGEILRRLRRNYLLVVCGTALWWLGTSFFFVRLPVRQRVPGAGFAWLFCPLAGAVMGGLLYRLSVAPAALRRTAAAPGRFRRLGADVSSPLDVCVAACGSALALRGAAFAIFGTMPLLIPPFALLRGSLLSPFELVLDTLVALACLAAALAAAPSRATLMETFAKRVRAGS